MSWKAHWVHQAQTVAKQMGWTVAENAKGQLIFVNGDQHSKPVNFAKALKLAETADGEATTAISTVVEGFK